MLKILLIPCLIILGNFVFSVVYNFHSRKVIKQFNNFIQDYQPTILLNVSLKHTYFNGTRWYVNSEKIGDIYMMNDYWVILFRGKFIYTIESFPLVIAKDCSFFKRKFPDFSTYQLSKVNMKHSVRKEFEIHYKDNQYKHIKGEIKFKDLTPELKNQMQYISEWLV